MIKNEAQRKYYNKNKERLIACSINYYKKHQKACQEKLKQWKEKNKEHVRDRSRKYARIWSEENREHLRQYHRTPRYRISNNLRSRMWHVLKGIRKSKGTEKLLGCAFKDFKIYMEQKFKDGMSWDNYGKWEIDHIVPCSSFDLSLETEQAKCFHYTNLQPLWRTENRRKYNT